MTNSPGRKRKLAGRVRRKENNSSVQWRSARTDSSVTDFGRAGLSDGINPTPINLLHWHQTRKRRLWAHDPQVPFLRSPTCQAYVAPSFIPASDSHSQDGRSEKHTSELQSLMRISYAVFCLQQKTQPPC